MQSCNITSLIRKKRDKQALTPDEIGYLIKQYTRDTVPDYQMSAFLMAACLNGLDETEAAALTREMLHSGVILDLSDVPGLKVDKHSTGGVGDKTSLILGPIVAACGVPVPMIAGRGLGHTGGTIDKLEAIPGFNVNLDLTRFVEVLKKHKLVITGQTNEIAPADKRMYALRDVTATVESIPLIAGSIMSKKLAEGIDALVLDVKFGSGAFMKTRGQALQLAESLVSIGEEFGKQTIAYLTSMEQPLGNYIGNRLEVLESIECLKGRGPDDLMMVTHQLAGTMIWLGGKANTVKDGIRQSKEAISDGSAIRKFRDFVQEQGGKVESIGRPEEYTSTSHRFEITASRSGFVTAIDAGIIGTAAVELGAGRATKEDAVDPQAGIRLNFKSGDKIKEGEIVAVCFTNKEEVTKSVRHLLLDSIVIDDGPPGKSALITDIVTRDGTSHWNS